MDPEKSGDHERESSNPDDKPKDVKQPWEDLLADPESAKVAKAYAEHRLRGQGKALKEREAELAEYRKQDAERKQQEEAAAQKKLEAEGKHEQAREMERTARTAAEERAEKAESEASMLREEFEADIAERISALPASHRKRFEAIPDLNLRQQRALVLQLEKDAVETPKRRVDGRGGRTLEPEDAVEAGRKAGEDFIFGKKRGGK